MAIVLCLAMLIGTTFAWFTDSASTAVNKIQAGKLDIELQYATAWDEQGVPTAWEDAEGKTLNFRKAAGASENEAILWEPGCTYVLPELRIVNNGNLALKYTMTISGIAGDAELNEAIEWEYAQYSTVNGAYEAALGGSLSSGDSISGAIIPGENNNATDPIVIKGHMKESAGNEYQGKSIDGIGITVYATQDTVENDSFNNQYDKDAEYAVEVKTADELHKALENDDNVVLATDIALPNEWTPAGNGTRSEASFTGDSYTGIFNGNGKTISNVKNSLFGVVTGTVKNVKLVAAIDNTESDSVGAVARILAGGTISDVTVSGSVIGKKAVGGVVGRVLAAGTVSNCTNSATVESTSESDAAGGIVGKAYYTVTGKEMNIIGCKNTGTINGKYAAGGIVGFSAANVKNCENSGEITMTGTNASAVGGIIGEQTNYGTISGNKNTKDITVNGSTNVNVGGIIGWIRYQNNAAYANNMTIVVSGNENSGCISSGTSTGFGTGGIVGLAYNQAKVNGNKNTATAISGGTFAAGIVGGLQSNDQNLNTGESVRFVVTGNTSTTTEVNISGNNKALFAYNNDPGNNSFADISGNTTE